MPSMAWTSFWEQLILRLVEIPTVWFSKLKSNCNDYIDYRHDCINPLIYCGINSFSLLFSECGLGNALYYTQEHSATYLAMLRYIEQWMSSEAIRAVVIELSY